MSFIRTQKWEHLIKIQNPNYIAENVSKSVASTVAEETAISTAESIVNTLAPTLSNQVKNESIKSFTSSLNTLYTNID